MVAGEWRRKPQETLTFYRFNLHRRYEQERKENMAGKPQKTLTFRMMVKSIPNCDQFAESRGHLSSQLHCVSGFVHDL